MYIFKNIFVQVSFFYLLYKNAQKIGCIFLITSKELLQICYDLINTQFNVKQYLITKETVKIIFSFHGLLDLVQ